MNHLRATPRIEELVELAQHMENKLGVPGAIIIFGILVGDGLSEVAEAIKTSGMLMVQSKRSLKLSRTDKNGSGP